jgi:hypothetical protein
MGSYCQCACTKGTCQLSNDHEQALRGLLTPYLAGSLPAFFLFVSGCPALNTAAVRLLW